MTVNLALKITLIFFRGVEEWQISKFSPINNVKLRICRGICDLAVPTRTSELVYLGTLEVASPIPGSKSQAIRVSYFDFNDLATAIIRGNLI